MIINKTNGGDGIPAELFQILKDDAVKVLHLVCQQIWKTQKTHRTRNGQVHSNPKEGQCQRMLKLPHNCTNFFFNFIFFISWRLITLHYCSGFCHTLKWISHGFTCVPHPDPPLHLHLHPIPLGLPSAPGLSTCLMHPTWAGDLFHSW